MARRFPVQQTHPPSLDDPAKTEVVSTESKIWFSDPQIEEDAAADNKVLISSPPGFRFETKDEELIIFHYLKSFIHGDPLPRMDDDIHHVNIYKYNPKELAAEFKKGNEKEWFFIVERTKKYEGGKTPDCSAKGGYWKATGGETKINAGGGVFGSKTSLDFCTGKQPNGVKTEWIMQEYRLDHPLPHKKSHGDDKMLDTVLCKIYMTPVEKKRKAKKEDEEEEEEEDEEEEEGGIATSEDLNIKPKKKTRNDLPRPSPFDELSWIFYPPQQENVRSSNNFSIFG